MPQDAFSNLGLEEGLVAPGERRAALGFSGVTVWLTGLPASGKSTIATLTERALIARGRPAFRLDGDNLRRGLCAGLGFSAEERAENVRRAGHAALLMSEAGVVTLVALVSPYRAGRREARALHGEHGIPFLEAFVDAPVELCRERDPKGHYARAATGDLPHFTGVSDPYELPEHPELVLHTDAEPAERSVERLVEAIVAR